jgi:hypothetical protein
MRAWKLLVMLLLVGLSSCAQERRPMSATFPEAEWRDSVTVLLQAINAAMDEPKFSKPIRRLEDRDLPQLVEELASGTYNPGAWFLKEKFEVSIGQREPIVLPGVEYYFLHMPVSDPLSKLYSMRSGGILFEDPFYALLAAYNSARTRTLLMLPMVGDSQEAWSRRPELVRALSQKEYQPERFFVECISLAGPLQADLLVLKGSVLDGLRKEGFADIAGKQGLAKYALYFRR